MYKFSSFLTEATTYKKYESFTGRILILGYGSVGQAILPLILRHLTVYPGNITVLEKDNHKALFDSRHGKSGVKYVRKEILPENYKKELAKYVGPGDMIVNCSLNIQALALLEWCAQNDVMQVDTSLERWGHQQDEVIPKLADRTLFHTHNEVRAAMSKYPNGPTLCVTHGANPGMVTHLTKRALLQLAKENGRPSTAPADQEGWAQLMKALGVKVIHVAERDTQITDQPKVKGEFVNTWSVEGFWAEGRAPAEMGWGTHENRTPEGGRSQGTAAYLFQPGMSVLMKSWVPKGGQYNGFCIQHSESITLSQFFSTKDGKFRPSVYYVYHPCDSAIVSVHELRGHELEEPREERIMKDEVISGEDELGVLLIGDDFAFWHGSQMTIEDARALIPGENATSVQVAGSLIAAIVWMIRNPRMGYIEPEAIPYDEILEIADMYWEPLKSVMSNWTPSKDVNSLFYKEFDKKHPCRFENFRVWS